MILGAQRFSYRTPCLVDGRFCSGRSAGIRVGDGDSAKWLAADDPRLFRFGGPLRLPDESGAVSVPMRPPVDRDGTNVTFRIGENDVRVPPPQSVELYRALRSNGVPTHLYIAPREPHGWRELRHELFKVNVELEWFETHVRGRDYAWESAPGDEEEEEAKTTENP